MSQEDPRHDPTPPQSPEEPAAAPEDAPQAATAAEDESTVGTGTSIALGCIGATLMLIVFALIMLGIMALI